MFFAHYLENYISQSFHISHAYLSCRITCHVLVLGSLELRSRSQGFFCIKWFPLIFLRTVYYRAIIFHMLIGLGKDMTPIDFRFTRMKVKVKRVICKKCKQCS